MLVPKGLPPVKVAIILGVVIIVLGVSGYVVYTNFFGSGSGGNNSAFKAGSALEATFILPETRGFDPDFFNDPAVRVLKNYGSLPVVVGQTGRSDPFAAPPVSSGRTSRSRQ